MEDQLGKIDELRRRFDITYQEAADVLQEADGDLFSALVMLEQRKKGYTSECCDNGSEMFQDVKDKIKEAAHKKIVVTKHGRVVAQIPMAIGALGALGAIINTPIAIIAGVGAVTALAKDYKFGIKDKED